MRVKRDIRGQGYYIGCKPKGKTEIKYKSWGEKPSPLKLKQILSLLERLLCSFSSREPSWLGMICGASRQMVDRGHDGRAVTLWHYLPVWTHCFPIHVPVTSPWICGIYSKGPNILLHVIFHSYYCLSSKYHCYSDTWLQKFTRINKMKKIWHCIWHIFVLFLATNKQHLFSLQCHRCYIKAERYASWYFVMNQTKE